MKKNNNPQNKLEQKLQLAKRVTLSVEEKERMKAFLSSYQEFNPARKKDAKVKRAGVLPIYIRFAIPAFMFVVFFVGGGVVLAERSLPGDPLYSLKTSFEDVRGRFAVSSESKARWNSDRVERRLSEARILASDGRLSEEVAEALAMNLDSYSTSIEETLEELRNNDKKVVALEIDGEYRSTVRIYKNLLSQTAAKNNELIALLDNITTQDNRVAVAQHTEEMVGLRSGETAEGITPSREIEIERLEDTPSENENEENNTGDAMVMAFSVRVGDSDGQNNAGESKEIDERVEEEEGRGEEDKDSEVALEIRTTSVADNVDQVDALTEVEIFNLPIDTLELFVATQLEKAQLSLKGTKLERDLRKEISERMEKIREYYESIKKDKEIEDREKFRSNYKHILRSVEDIRATLRASRSVPQSDILKSLLESSKDQIEEHIKSPLEDKNIPEVESQMELKVDESATRIKEGVEDVLKRFRH